MSNAKGTRARKGEENRVGLDGCNKALGVREGRLRLDGQRDRDWNEKLRMGPEEGAKGGTKWD